VLSRVIELHFLIMLTSVSSFAISFASRTSALLDLVCRSRLVDETLPPACWRSFAPARIRVPVFESPPDLCNDRFDAFISDDGVFIRFKLGPAAQQSRAGPSVILANDIQILEVAGEDEAFFSRAKTRRSEEKIPP